MLDIGKIAYFVAPSRIHGEGLFAAQPIFPGQIVDLAFIEKQSAGGKYPDITYFGSKLNHSYFPNVRLQRFGNKFFIKAIKVIPSRHELLVNYSETPSYIMKPGRNFT